MGFGMERLPCEAYAANAIFFRLVVVAYNLFVLFKLLALPSSWRRCQVRTVRWRLYQIAGKVTCRARILPATPPDVPSARYSRGRSAGSSRARRLNGSGDDIRDTIAAENDDRV